MNAALVYTAATTVPHAQTQKVSSIRVLTSECLFELHVDQRNISEKEKPFYIQSLNLTLKVKTSSHALAHLGNLPYLVFLHTGSYSCGCKNGYSGDGGNCSGEPLDLTCAQESFQRLSVTTATFFEKELLKIQNVSFVKFMRLVTNATEIPDF